MTTRRARALRSSLTDAERNLWSHLCMRQVRGFKFRRQRPIGPYIADFICLERRLIIEVDGSQHAQHAERDARRDDYLTGLGFNVFRFWDNSVLKETGAVLEVIAQALEGEGDPHPRIKYGASSALPPLAGEGTTLSLVESAEEQELP